MTAEETAESARIAEGRVRHGVGASKDFPGNVCHLVSPVVGMLRLRQRDGEPLTEDDFEWFIDRLGLALDMARHEAEQAILRPGVECDCDYWHSKHRFHCATNFPTSRPAINRDPS